MLGQETLIKNLLSQRILFTIQWLPMKKKELFTATLSGLFLLAVAQLFLVKLVNANPYIDHKFVSSPVNPTTTILSPKNNTIYASSNLTLNFNTIIDNRNFEVRIKSVYYQTSWQTDNVTLYRWSDHDPLNLYDDDPFINEYSRNLSLT